MSSLTSRMPQIADASVDEKLALIDELWESVRRSAVIQIREAHVTELAKRAAAVNEDPAIALTPAQARAPLRK